MIDYQKKPLNRTVVSLYLDKNRVFLKIAHFSCAIVRKR
jgi:hypothetical protein